ncbi:uncharacterized protein SAPINGB_P001929 [Magnusiomyces paraingens]|uniref:Glycosyltransferase family 15 protein n=1 Tax=Magnusiomyces paraingens TaxID=2606893 RepID=A0A5E8BBW3_9ASCO|nr:uncharacterized protein SAPINGB_P001929 [Saprochaete ingens]VVT48743.1 unnamed protein product [Saprochaete ingens]
MSRYPKLLRLVVLLTLLILGLVYISTYHREYVNSISDKSMNTISDIYKQNFGETTTESEEQQPEVLEEKPENASNDEKKAEEAPKEQEQQSNENENENKNQEQEQEQPSNQEEPKKEVDNAVTSNPQFKITDNGDIDKPNNGIPPKLTTFPGAEYVRENATFVTLARNSDLWELVESINHVEDRFNRKFKYDWVFLNDKPFDENFIKVTTNLVSGKTHYGLIPPEHWSFPDWIDKDRAALVREEMRAKKIIYGDSVPYRHMCRFESGFFWRQPVMNQFKYYWRVEPGIKLYCDIDYDVFKYMAENKLKYGFTISLYEYRETIATLWDNVKKFLTEGGEKYLAKNNLMNYVSDNNGDDYNLCHFWSNFEIGDLDFWRGEAYRSFFKFLDQAGGFFYERWGDAPVHSIAASLFLNKNEIHHFEDIGYYHAPFHHCPTTEEMRTDRRCVCNPDENFAWKGYSCTPKFYNAYGLTRPKGWSEQSE